MAAARAVVVDQNSNKGSSKLKLLTPLAIFTESTIALAIAWSGYSVFVLQNFGVFGENHLLENLQALTLFAVLAVCLVPIFQSHRSDRLLCIFFAWLTIGFLLREIDVDELNVHAFFVKWGAGSGRNLLLALALAAMSVMALMRLRFYLDLAKQFLVSAPGITALKSGVLLIAGDICEKVAFAHHVFFEEVFELVAYAVLLRAATLLARHKVESKITT
jgi:hypothetical protein